MVRFEGFMFVILFEIYIVFEFLWLLLFVGKL